MFSRQPHSAASVQVRQIYKYTVENLCNSNVLRKVEVVSKWVMLWEVFEPGFYKTILSYVDFEVLEWKFVTD